MSVKKFFKNLPTRIWFIVSCVFAFILLVVNIALAVPTVQDLAGSALGTGKAIASGDVSKLQYYKKTTSSKEEAKQKGDTFNVSLAEEGITMLKNKDGAFPIAKNSKVSIFGKNSANFVYGGTGSGAVNTDEAKTLKDSLTAVGMTVNPTLEAFYNGSASGSGRPANPDDLDTGGAVSLETGETPYSMYTQSVIDSYKDYNDLALVIFSRIGGEGFDLPFTKDGKKHYLELDDNEIDMLKNVTKAGFKKVAVIINSGNAMELGFTKEDYEGITASEIDGVFLVPGTGTTGIMALGEILVGDVNPSGHTVDTYATDFTAIPSYQNFGVNGAQPGQHVENSDEFMSGEKFSSYYFTDYEEGIYVGYRYYETRAAVDGEDWYSKNVVYPFGYGLSYTTFKYEIDNKASISDKLTKDGKVKVEVKVTNTGSADGKAVVQLYGHAPYIKGQIQKSEVILVDFAKTPIIKSGASETVSVEIDPYLMASYDYKDENKDGFKGYTLDKGDYIFSIRSDSHTVEDSFHMNLDDTVTYENDPTTGNKVENQYTGNTDSKYDSDIHLQTILNRDDFNGTFPKSPAGDDYQLSSEWLTVLKDKKNNNPNTYEMPDLTVKEENKNLKLYDLFEKNEDGSLKLNEFGVAYMDYDNPLWEQLVSRVSLDDAMYMINHGAFHTVKNDDIDKPYTDETDGPVGFVNFMFKAEFYGTAAYCSQVLVGMTYNQELVEEWGAVVGEEGLWGDIKNNRPYSGWYAPGMNIHRSPFGGRNFEYFSEDPIHTGLMAAAEIRGARSKGVYNFAKHFALNEQETHRQSNGDISFVTEQAMREIYLKPFEIAVKQGKAIGIMTSFNRIGLRWSGGDYRLVTTILKDEWGFRGAVINDFNTPAYMPVKQMTYAGGDINLSTTRFWESQDWNNAGDVTVVRKALKNILYTVGNSNAMNGHGEGVTYSYTLPTYRILQIIIDVVLPVAIIAWGVPVFLIVRKRPGEQN